MALLRHQVSSSWTHFVWQTNDIKAIRETMHNFWFKSIYGKTRSSHICGFSSNDEYHTNCPSRIEILKHMKGSALVSKIEFQHNLAYINNHKLLNQYSPTFPPVNMLGFSHSNPWLFEGNPTWFRSSPLHLQHQEAWPRDNMFFWLGVMRGFMSPFNAKKKHVDKAPIILMPPLGWYF